MLNKYKKSNGLNLGNLTSRLTHPSGAKENRFEKQKKDSLRLNPVYCLNFPLNLSSTGSGTIPFRFPPKCATSLTNDELR